MAKTGYERLKDKFKGVNVHTKTYDKLLILAKEKGISTHKVIEQLMEKELPDSEVKWDFPNSCWVRK